MAFVAGCAGGARPRGTVRSGLVPHDEYFGLVRALLARVERAEAAVVAKELLEPPSGVRVRVQGEGPAALAEVSGEVDDKTRLRTLLAAEDLANAPVQMDAVAGEAEALLAKSEPLRREAMLIPFRQAALHAAHADALALLRELPERARKAAQAARDLLQKLR